jgi:hypothetical protein
MEEPAEHAPEDESGKQYAVERDGAGYRRRQGLRHQIAFNNSAAFDDCVHAFARLKS